MSKKLYMDMCYDTGCYFLEDIDEDLDEIKSLVNNKDYATIEKKLGTYFNLLKDDCNVLANLGLNLKHKFLDERILETVLDFLIHLYSGDKYSINVDTRFSIDEQVGDYCINHDIDRGIIYAKTPVATYIYTIVDGYDVYFIGTVTDETIKPKYTYYLNEDIVDGVYLIRHPEI